MVTDVKLEVPSTILNKLFGIEVIESGKVIDVNKEQSLNALDAITLVFSCISQEVTYELSPPTKAKYWFSSFPK